MSCETFRTFIVVLLSSDKIRRQIAQAFTNTRSHRKAPRLRFRILVTFLSSLALATLLVFCDPFFWPDP